MMAHHIRLSVIAGVAVVAVIASAIFVHRFATRAEAVDNDTIERIINTPQNYDGQQIDALVQLGPQAIPAIGATLLEGDDFPLRLVFALARLGDAAATDPLMRYLQSLAPGEPDTEYTLVVETINALQAVEGRKATTLLFQLMNGESVHPAIRLASASAVAKLGGSSEQKEAEEFILDQYENRFSLLSRPPDKTITSDQLIEALIAANTERSQEIILDLVRDPAAASYAQELFDYLLTVDNPTVVNVLMQVVKSPESYEVYYRILALETLIGHSDGALDSELSGYADDLVKQATEEGVAPEVVERAKALIRSQ